MSGQASAESGSEELQGANQGEIWRAVARTAAEWGVELPREVSPRHELTLPVAAGIRLGSAQIRLRVPGSGGRIEWEVLSSEYRTHRTAVAVLLFGAAGGLVAAAWPFVPALLPLAPLGLVLAIAAWLLVSARVKYRGVEQFWQAVREELQADREENAD